MESDLKPVDKLQETAGGAGQSGLGAGTAYGREGMCCMGQPKGREDLGKEKEEIDQSAQKVPGRKCDISEPIYGSDSDRKSVV